jgi:hypothetical protein
MFHSVFKDNALNNLLNKQGYVIVPFLSSEEVELLREFFDNSEKAHQEHFTTFASNSKSYRRLVDEAIKNVFARSFCSYFQEYEPFWGNFFTKPTKSPAMPLHADLQYVNEPQFISLNIWTPLVDTNIHNGAFGVVPFSHKALNQIRGTNITDAYRKNAKEIETAHGKILELKAGEAVIYDHRLLHYSLPNVTDFGRLSATMVVVPKGVPLLHYFASFEGNTTIYKYQIRSVEDFLDTDFLMEPTHLSPIETKKNHVSVPLTVEDFNFVE